MPIRSDIVPYVNYIDEYMLYDYDLVNFIIAYRIRWTKKYEASCNFVHT